MEPRTPARDLEQALARMRWTIEPGSFALIGFSAPPQAADLAALDPPAQIVRESDETSILLRAEALEAVLARHPGAAVERDLAWIRFEAAMGWEVVGFLALVTGELARAGVPLGAVCGHSRDHLFFPRRHLDRARSVLERLFPAPPGGPAASDPVRRSR